MPRISRVNSKADVACCFVSLWLAVIVLWHFGYPRTGSIAPDEPATHIIEIRQMKFVPNRITVSPGDTVVWINRDFIVHNVAEEDNRWKSADLQQGHSFSHRVAGSTSYHCTFHPVMTGKLAVTGTMPDQ